MPFRASQAVEKLDTGHVGGARLWPFTEWLEGAHAAPGLWEEKRLGLGKHGMVLMTFEGEKATTILAPPPH